MSTDRDLSSPHALDTSLEGQALDRTGSTRAIEALRRSNRLLEALARAQSRFIAGTEPRAAFEDLLCTLLELTESEYGFIGEVHRGSDGQPYLKTHAITNIAWNEETRAHYDRYARDGLEFYNTRSLFGVVLLSGEAVIANEPARDPRRAGTPQGHPPLRSFLGLPFNHGGEMVGMVGIANRPGGYDQAIVGYLAPFLTTCASLVAAHRNERRRQEAEASLRRLNTELERVNQELESFTYSVSHDLKAPLRGIHGYSELLLDGYADRLDDEGRQFVDRICKASRQMSQLIDDLLAYSRLERRPLAISPVALQAMVAELLAERSAEIAGRGAEVRVDIPWARIVADREGLAMALRNLLGNALKFTRDAQPPRIEIAGRETDTAWTLWVRDNGCGFDMRYYDRIFELFQRLHSAADYPGTGIGLALVRKAMQRMGGRVWAEGTPGAGATFYLEIPRPA